MLAYMCNNYSLFMLMRAKKLLAWYWFASQDVSLIVYIWKTDHFIRLYKLDRDRQRDILEIKHIFTIVISVSYVQY